jgi:putative phosphoribosyl transferase
MHFKDRVDAGRQLAQALSHYRNRQGIIYPLPRGGIVLGIEIARDLHMPLDLIIPRKIGHPYNPEYAICAVTEHGEPICNEHELARVDHAWFEEEVRNERQEARRRRELYLGDKKPLDVKDKTAILVDDGIATGLTMRAAIQDVKQRKPAHIVVAVPVSPTDTAEQLKQEVDEVIALDIPEFYLGAVGAYYDDFAQVTDAEVIELLQSLASTP